MPQGTNMGTMFVAMKHYVDKSGDPKLLRRFVESKGAAKISEAGSMLGTMGKYKDETTPTGAMASVEQTRKQAARELKENPLAKNILKTDLIGLSKNWLML